MITDEEYEQYRELRRQQAREREYRLIKRWHDLLDSILPGGRSPFEVENMRDLCCNEPILVFESFLGDDADGSHPLPDETVARLWDIGYEMGFDQDELMDDETLAAARPERRTRPGPPWNLFGGGHGPGRAIPGKREFPSRWSDETTLQHTMDVAQHPSGAVQLPNRDFRAWGERDGVLLSVLLSPIGEVLTSYPVSGEGVVQHPVHRRAEGLMPLLRNLLESVVAPSAEEPRCSMDELLAVGEWPHLILSMEALGADEPTIVELRKLAGL